MSNEKEPKTFDIIEIMKLLDGKEARLLAGGLTVECALESEVKLKFKYNRLDIHGFHSSHITKNLLKEIKTHFIEEHGYTMSDKISEKILKTLNAFEPRMGSISMGGVTSMVATFDKHMITDLVLKYENPESGQIGVLTFRNIKPCRETT
jgi:hypothetical protein